MRPHDFDSYKDKYETISLERSEGGILQITLHGHGKPDEQLDYAVPYGWDHPHVEWSHCFYDVARDAENEVVILTHAGDSFIDEAHAHYRSGAANVGKLRPIHPTEWDWPMSDGRWLQMNLLSIECPVIGAVRGAAHVHAQLITQSDIVLCAEDASFQDLPHFEGGLYAPGDGVQITWPATLGPTRGKYFLLTGQVLDAQRALELGVVNEVLPGEQLLPRAFELAREILKRPRLVRRAARVLITQEARRQLVDHLGYGLALEGLGAAGWRKGID